MLKSIAVFSWVQILTSVLTLVAQYLFVTQTYYENFTTTTYTAKAAITRGFGGPAGNPPHQRGHQHGRGHHQGAP